MPKTEAQFQLIREKSKSRILAAALALFSENGFHATSIQMIAERAGIAAGLLYNYFESKEQLFREVLEQTFYPLMDTDFSQYSQDSLSQFCQDYLAYQASVVQAVAGQNSFSMSYFTVLFDALKLMYPEFSQKYKASKQKEVAAWTAVVANARKTGEIRTSLSDEQVARIFFHTSENIGLQLVIEGRIQDYHGETSALWNSFYAALKA